MQRHLAKGVIWESEAKDSTESAYPAAPDLATFQTQLKVPAQGNREGLQNGFLAELIAGFLENLGRFLQRCDGLGIPPGFLQGKAEMAQRDALAVPVTSIAEDHGSILQRCDGLGEPPYLAQRDPKVFSCSAFAVLVGGIAENLRAILQRHDGLREPSGIYRQVNSSGVLNISLAAIGIRVGFLFICGVLRQCDLERLGVKHIAFKFDDLSGAAEEFKRMNFGEMTGIQNGRTVIRYFFVADPDGNWVEITQDNRALNPDDPAFVGGPDR